MGKKRYSLVIRGNYKTWSFDILAKPEHVADWRADGFEVDEIVNTIPLWVAELGLARAWVFCQDVFYLRNPFRS